jgi:hypothetical protein
MTEDLDRELALLLAPAERAADEDFTGRVRLAVLAEQRLRTAQQRTRRRFAAEAAATAAVLVAFLVLATGQPDGRGWLEAASPAMAGVLLLGLWSVVALGAGPGRRIGRA